MFSIIIAHVHRTTGSLTTINDTNSTLTFRVKVLREFRNSNFMTNVVTKAFN